MTEAIWRRWSIVISGSDGRAGNDGRADNDGYRNIWLNIAVILYER